MPQLKKVVLAYGNELIYTDTYEQALAQLAGGQGASSAKESKPGEAVPVSTAPATPNGAERIVNLRQWMDRYRKAAQQGQWTEAGKALEALEAELRKKP